jgi:GTPase SAR1 family protein
MRSGEGFILVYSITSRSSFDEVSAFYQQILRVKDRDAYPVVIVANKVRYRRKIPASFFLKHAFFKNKYIYGIFSVTCSMNV